MVKIEKNYKRLKGSQSFRQRLLLSTLSSTPIIIEDIRTHEAWPGLHSHEISLLRLFETVCDDCRVVINETGTKLKYEPGIIMGGRINRPHECDVSRSIGYFLEPLVVLCLFAKEPLTITLKGITNDSKDPSVDTFKSAAFHILKRFGVDFEALSLKIESRGLPPNGGGEVILSLPIVQSLTAVNWIDEGFVKKIRGVTFSTKVSSQFENSMIRAARGIINPLVSDVHIFTDHRTGPPAGNSPGYGILLVAETTSGCYISVDTAASHGRDEDASGLEDDIKKDLMPPEDIGEGIANALLEEIGQSGVVDSTYQTEVNGTSPTPSDLFVYTHTPSDLFVYTHQHRKNKTWVDRRSEHVYGMYKRIWEELTQQESLQGTPPPKKIDVWTEVAGIRKGHVYGLGSESSLFACRRNYGGSSSSSTEWVQRHEFE